MIPITGMAFEFMDSVVRIFAHDTLDNLISTEVSHIESIRNQVNQTTFQNPKINRSEGAEFHIEDEELQDILQRRKKAMVFRDISLIRTDLFEAGVQNVGIQEAKQVLTLAAAKLGIPLDAASKLLSGLEGYYLSHYQNYVIDLLNNPELSDEDIEVSITEQFIRSSISQSDSALELANCLFQNAFNIFGEMVTSPLLSRAIIYQIATAIGSISHFLNWLGNKKDITHELHRGQDSPMDVLRNLFQDANSPSFSIFYQQRLPQYFTKVIFRH